MGPVLSPPTRPRDAAKLGNGQKPKPIRSQIGRMLTTTLKFLVPSYGTHQNFPVIDTLLPNAGRSIYK